MMMGGGGGGGGAAPAAGGEAAAPAEEKTDFDVKLTGFDDKAKIKVIKEVRALTGLVHSTYQVGTKSSSTTQCSDSRPCVVALSKKWTSLAMSNDGTIIVGLVDYDNTIFGSSQFSSDSGQNPGQCYDCPVGRYSTELGLEYYSDCPVCAKGRYTDQTAMKICKGCAKGTYSDEEGRSKSMNTTDSVGIITNSTSKNNMLSFSPVNQNHSPEVKYSEKKQEQVLHLTEAYKYLLGKIIYFYCTSKQSSSFSILLSTSMQRHELGMPLVWQ